MRIKLVIATRKSEEDFYEKTATGKSLAFNRPPILEIRLFPNNDRGLPAVYNQAIQESMGESVTLIFAHDDLHILDFYWLYRIKEGLTHFDVIGAVGNKNRSTNQSSWAFIDEKFTWDKTENLSGIIGNGSGFPPSSLSIYGETRQKVKLLDGLLLAVENKTLIDHHLFFDERFMFHFYDLDFCRQAEQKNISCGTWDLSLIHESSGSCVSDSWKISYQQYIDKWGN